MPEQLKKNLIAPFGAITIFAWVIRFERLYILFMERHIRRQKAIELSKLDDWQLDDIGINRAEIHSDLSWR